MDDTRLQPVTAPATAASDERSMRIMEVAIALVALAGALLLGLAR